jgi:transcriptional regulator with XRE-family HTH domain
MESTPRETTDDELASRLADNVRTLREARGLSQKDIARLAGVPRATWAHLESGGANPTLAVLRRAAQALSVPFEELLGEPAPAAKHYPRAMLPERRRGEVIVRSLLPHRVPGMVLERLHLAPRARLQGTPHMPGTREYLTCEAGRLELVASGERFVLEEGDVVVFRGDQKHSYGNPGGKPAIGYSVVVLRPGA